MTEYDVAFGRRLADIARQVVAEGLGPMDARRAVLYLGLLSTEISLKAMLERAGFSVTAIQARSHRLADLLRDLGQCEIEREIAPGHSQYVPATCLRGCEIKRGGAMVTVGTVIEAEAQDSNVSKFPNQVRYGDVLRHYPADVVAEMARLVSEFAYAHWDTIRTR